MPLQFDNNSVRIIAGQVRRLEMELAAVRRQVSAGINELGDDTVLIAKTGVGGVAARAAATPGSDTVTVYKVDSGGDLASTGVEVTAYNLASSAVAGSTYIQIKREARSYKWLVDFEDCG